MKANALKAFQLMAKRQKAELQALLESLGDQAVAMSGGAQ